MRYNFSGRMLAFRTDHPVRVLNIMDEGIDEHDIEAALTAAKIAEQKALEEKFAKPQPSLRSTNMSRDALMTQLMESRREDEDEVYGD